MDEFELRAILSRSVRAEDLKLVVDFIKQHGFHLNNKIDLNVRDDFGRTPIFYAVQSGNIEIVEFLIETKVDLNIRDLYGMTPILFVIRQPDNSIKVEMMKLLLSKGASPDFFYFEKHETVLHIAAERGYTDVVKALIEFKSNVNSEAKDGSTPLLLACQYNHLRVVKCLLEARADVNVRVSSNGYTPLHYAAKAGSKDMAELLLEHGALVNSIAKDKTHTPLLLACKNNALSVVKCLLEAKADVNAPEWDSGYTAGHYAVGEGLKNMDELLLEHRALVNIGVSFHWSTPLHYAAEAGFKDIVELLLVHGALVNSINVFNQTPLHLASKYNHLCVVKCLLEARADVNAQESMGYTSLHYAAEAGSKDMTELLLEHGALVNTQCYNGCTPLHIACKPNKPVERFHVTKLLLEHGAQVDRQNERCETALNLACFYKLTSIAELLLKFDANPNARNRKIRLPDQLDDELTEILLSSGAVFIDASLSSKAIGRHIVKLNMSIYASFNSPLYDDEFKKSKYELDCEEEISRMMSVKIGETNLTLYNILASDVGEVAVMSNNREVCRVFEEGNLNDIYPIYGKELRRRFHNGLERSELLKKAVISFHSVCSVLPQEICEKILSYLRHKDLVTFNRIAA